MVLAALWACARALRHDANVGNPRGCGLLMRSRSSEGSEGMRADECVFQQVKSSTLRLIQRSSDHLRPLPALSHSLNSSPR